MCCRDATKIFQCNKCMEKHVRPVNSKCQRQQMVDNDSCTSVESDHNPKGSGLNQALSVQILAELKQLSGRIQQVEEKVHQQGAAAGSGSQPPQTIAKLLTEETALPTVATIRRSTYIQQEVDARLQELWTLNEQGKFKS